MGETNESFYGTFHLMPDLHVYTPALLSFSTFASSFFSILLFCPTSNM